MEPPRGSPQLTFLASISSLESVRQAGQPEYKHLKTILPTLSIHWIQPSHRNSKCSFCILLGMWVANKPKEIKIETRQARPPSTGKNIIYLINSVPKQQPVSLPRRAVFMVYVHVCVNVCKYMHAKYIYTYAWIDKHTDLPPTENIYSYSSESQTALLSPNPANIKNVTLCKHIQSLDLHWFLHRQSCTFLKCSPLTPGDGLWTTVCHLTKATA